MASAATRNAKRTNGKYNTIARRKGIAGKGNSTDAKSVNGTPDKPPRKMHPNSLAALQKTMWKPGQSGNPLGPQAGAKNPAVAAAKLRAIVTDAVDVAHSIMTDPDAPASARMSAVHDVLDRVLGKAIQTTVSVDASNANALETMATPDLGRYVAQLLSERGIDPGEASRLIGSGGSDIIDVTPSIPDVVPAPDAGDSAETSTQSTG